VACVDTGVAVGVGGTTISIVDWCQAKSWMVWFMEQL